VIQYNDADDGPRGSAGVNEHITVEGPGGSAGVNEHNADEGAGGSTGCMSTTQMRVPERAQG
jgi:hypothetical protein